MILRADSEEACYCTGFPRVALNTCRQGNLSACRRQQRGRPSSTCSRTSCMRSSCSCAGRFSSTRQACSGRRAVGRHRLEQDGGIPLRPVVPHRAAVHGRRCAVGVQRRQGEAAPAPVRRHAVHVHEHCVHDHHAMLARTSAEDHLHSGQQFGLAQAVAAVAQVRHNGLSSLFSTLICSRSCT